MTKKPDPDKFPGLKLSDPVEAIDNQVKIRVYYAYVPMLSRPQFDVFIFLYLIEIENRGDRELQLLFRNWQIVDGLGKQWEVEGEGVVGKQPYIMPGEKYSYDSWTQFETPMGRMSGYYEMRDVQTQELIRVKIPRFELSCARMLN